MVLTVLCTQLAEAVTKDKTPEEGGCDISAGLFGPNLSKWLRELADIVARAPLSAERGPDLDPISREYFNAYADAQFEAAVHIWASIQRHNGDPCWMYVFPDLWPLNGEVRT
jgi:hypothetical protein